MSRNNIGRGSNIFRTLNKQCMSSYEGCERRKKRIGSYLQSRNGEYDLAAQWTDGWRISDGLSKIKKKKRTLPLNMGPDMICISPISDGKNFDPKK